MIRYLIQYVLILLSGPVLGQVRCIEFTRIVLTHSVVPAGPVPTAMDPGGVYPYQSYSETADRPVPVSYRFVRIENDSVSIEICPDLGGKITSMVHKSSGKEVLYKPEVIRPVRILPRFSFVAGGIEVSFPISHTPSQNEKVLYRIDETPDRIYVTCGERELRFGMQWSVEYSIGPWDSFLTQRVKLHNPGKKNCPWMSWSNAALPAASDTKFYFPAGPVLRHSSKLDTIDWVTEGPELQKDITEMTGFFWLKPDKYAFGAFTPSEGCGLYHISGKESTPGIKLWSYGTGRDSAWSLLSTATARQYIEIQGGPARDQSVKKELEPGVTLIRTEYWKPVKEALDIYSLTISEPELRDESLIPLFPWAREECVKPWNDLLYAFDNKRNVPIPPPIELNIWAPSGMDQMDEAFRWAIQNSQDELSDLWKYHYGTWKAGIGDIESALDILSDCRTGIAKALLARLLRQSGKSEEAVIIYRTIEETWLQLHPQIIVERDKALRDLGPQSLAEREYWLQKVNSLEDEWIIVRRVQWMIDKGEVLAAKDLLLSVHFQKVHQDYTRTNLWFQICHNLGEPCFPLPESLGEDRLAGFGTYREFE